MRATRLRPAMDEYFHQLRDLQQRTSPRKEGKIAPMTREFKFLLECCWGGACRSGKGSPVSEYRSRWVDLLSSNPSVHKNEPICTRLSTAFRQRATPGHRRRSTSRFRRPSEVRRDAFQAG